jgi:hypothetical protein
VKLPGNGETGIPFPGFYFSVSYFEENEMTHITGAELKRMNNALDKNCTSCGSPCPFDDGDECLISKIKDLLREHVEVSNV